MVRKSIAVNQSAAFNGYSLFVIDIAGGGNCGVILSKHNTYETILQFSGSSSYTAPTITVSYGNTTIKSNSGTTNVVQIKIS